MRLEDLTTDDRGEGRRIAARVVWEGPHRGPELLWFESDAKFAADFEPAPEAFLTAALPLAAGFAEPRLRVAGRVCERLRAGLETASRLVASWYPASCREVAVEATEGSGTLAGAAPPRASAFLSGGVDSLAMVRRNRLDVPHGDRRSFRDAIHLFGWNSYDFEGPTPRPERLRMHGEQRARLEGFAARSGLTLLPVRSNVRTFHPSYPWSRDLAFSAGMIAPVHAFSRRISEASFASGGYPGAHPPHGSHPDLDPLWSSSAVEIHHGDADRTRMQKVRLVSEWDEALAVLEVCLHREVAPPGEVNCGRCEKCLRTRLALVALGASSRAPTFRSFDVSSAEVASMRLPPGFGASFTAEMLPPLEAAGRDDLAQAVRSAVERADRTDARRRRWWRRALRRVTHGRDALS